MKLILLVTLLTFADAFNFWGVYVGINKHNVSSPNAKGACGVTPKSCPKTPYRSYDGSCNNLKNPSWGTPNTTYARLLPANYGDGLSSFPTAKSGNPLPNPRAISLFIFTNKEVNSNKSSLSTMQVGQLMAHDMSSMSGVPNPRISCCLNGMNVTNPNPRCSVIPVPPNDDVHPGQQCLNFLRTITTRDLNCTAPDAPVEPITDVTAYLDASFVYGSTETVAKSLRSGKCGKLKSVMRHGHEWPPQVDQPTQSCRADNNSEPCYAAGDPRVNQNPQLTMLQVMFMRMHNRVAEQLCVMNKCWNDEKLYQETRRIIITIFQHIIYYELLPIYLGRENMLKGKLLYENPTCYVNDYDDTASPATTIEHASIASRQFHSSVAGFVNMYDEELQFTGSLRMSTWFDRPSIIETGCIFANLARGLNTQPEMAMDRYYHNEMTTFFFRGNNVNGSDLRAIDIQRARDHGARPYNDIREHCGLRRATEFQDFCDYIPQEDVDKLSQIYESPEDVDAAVAGPLETPVNGSQVGPTFLCIMLEQYYRLRIADRFFYENGNQDGSFTCDQLNAIRKFTMSSFFCEVGQIDRIQKRALDLISDSNPVVPCCEIPKLKLAPWKDSKKKLLDKLSPIF